MTIICLIIIAFLIVIIYLASQRIKWQDKDTVKLLKEASKASNDLRLKGIEIDVLRNRIKKAEKGFNIRIVG